MQILEPQAIIEIAHPAASRHDRIPLVRHLRRPAHAVRLVRPWGRIGQLAVVALPAALHLPPLTVPLEQDV